MRTFDHNVFNEGLTVQEFIKKYYDPKNKKEIVTNILKYISKLKLSKTHTWMNKNFKDNIGSNLDYIYDKTFEDFEYSNTLLRQVYFLPCTRNREIFFFVNDDKVAIDGKTHEKFLKANFNEKLLFGIHPTITETLKLYEDDEEDQESIDYIKNYVIDVFLSIVDLTVGVYDEEPYTAVYRDSMVLSNYIKNDLMDIFN